MIQPWNEDSRNKSIERCASQMIWLTLGQSRRSDQQLPQDPFFRITYSLQWSTGLTTLDPCTSNQMQDAPYQLLNALHMCAYGVGVLTCFMAAFVHYIYRVLMKLSLFFLFCCIYIYIYILYITNLRIYIYCIIFYTLQHNARIFAHYIIYTNTSST
jgi:hypothetical protein